jgi:hypothetical protein
MTHMEATLYRLGGTGRAELMRSGGASLSTTPMLYALRLELWLRSRILGDTDEHIVKNIRSQCSFCVWRRAENSLRLLGRL